MCEEIAPGWPQNYDPLPWYSDFCQFIAYFNGKRILDLGCGSGEIASWFLARGMDYTGIDFSPGMIEQAQAYLPEADFRCMDLYHLNFQNDEFDGFWVSCVLDLIPKRNLPFVLSEIRRIVKNDGIGFIAVHEGTWEGLIKIQHWWMRRPLSIFIAEWEKNEFIDLLDYYGFMLIEYLSKYDGGPPGYFVRINK
jgi:ubiquinone/menaquinone biosynthesis C-methylase UbiE